MKISKNKLFCVFFFLLLFLSKYLTPQTTTTKKTIDFNLVKIITLGKTCVLIDTSGEKPIQLCPLATIDRVEEINTKENYAVVFCLNKYFLINKYGEMSFGFDFYDIFFDSTNNFIYCKKTKSQKCAALYNFYGKELGKMSEAKNSYMEYDMTTNEFYYLFVNKKGKKGLINSKGNLIIKDEYVDIGTINNGKCTVFTRNKEEIEVRVK